MATYTINGYKIETNKKPVPGELRHTWTALLYSPEGALILGHSGEGDTEQEALLDAAFNAGIHKMRQAVKSGQSLP